MNVIANEKLGLFVSIRDLAARRMAFARAEEALVYYTPFELHLRIVDFLNFLLKNATPTQTFTAVQLVGEFMVWVKVYP